MKYVFASRTGNVEALVASLGLDAIRIDDGNEVVDEDFVLFTYTDGYGDVPVEVDAFLSGNGSHIKGVVASGELSYGEAYGLAGDKIAEAYNCPLLYKLEDSGTDEDIAKLSTILESL